MMLTGNAGNDNYLTKPFDLRELHARMDALLKRADSKQKQNFLSAGDVTMEPEKFVVRKAGVDINLARRGFTILELFMCHQERVFSDDEISSRL